MADEKCYVCVSTVVEFDISLNGNWYKLNKSCVIL